MAWVGEVQPLLRCYTLGVLWLPNSDVPPEVKVLQPEIRPRKGVSYEAIPHLNFNSADPAFSSLCLFDPDTNEWCPRMWIADTFVPWAIKWVCSYEAWHIDGVWRGRSAPGPESVAEIRALARQSEESAA